MAKPAGTWKVRQAPPASQSEPFEETMTNVSTMSMAGQMEEELAVLLGISRNDVNTTKPSNLGVRLLKAQRVAAAGVCAEEGDSHIEREGKDDNYNMKGDKDDLIHSPLQCRGETRNEEAKKESAESFCMATESACQLKGVEWMLFWDTVEQWHYYRQATEETAWVLPDSAMFDYDNESAAAGEEGMKKRLICFS